MPWQGMGPVVARVTPTDKTGVTLTQEAMQMGEAQRERLPGGQMVCGYRPDLIHHPGYLIFRESLTA